MFTKIKDSIIIEAKNFSKAIVVPILYLPAIGTMVAICSLVINPNIKEMLPFINIPIIQNFFQTLHACLMAIFQNLGPIFAIGIAAGLAKQRKEQAVLIAFMSLFLYLAAQQTYLSITGQLVEANLMTAAGQASMLGFQIVDMGVFIGIIIGIVVSIIFNKYYEKDLGDIFSIYGGTRFVFLVCIPTMVFLAILMTFIWPPVQVVIAKTANVMLNTGGFGYFLFGFLERFLLPTGLHHLIGSPIWYTELGGSAIIDGEKFVGAWNMAIAELNNPTITKLSTTVIFNNINLVKIFGLTGVGLAMISTAKEENKRNAKMILLPAIITSVLAGITEPLEFTFLFLSPMLFFIYSLVVGGFFAILYVLNITTITAGGLLETLALNLPVSAAKSNWMLFFAIGIIQLIVMFFLFRWYIQKFDIKTPGREANIELIDRKAYESLKSGENKKTKIGEIILSALGGKDNIKTVDNCFTRLRLTLDKTDEIDEALLKENGAAGVVISGHEVQVIYGPNVTKYRSALEELL